MLRVRFAAGLLGLAAMAGTTNAQVKYELYNEQGASAPCLGIGLGVLIVKKCETAFQRAGFIHDTDLGYSGLTLGDTGAQDGVVTAVEPGFAGAQAGMKVGDVVVSVDGHSAIPSPAEVLAQRGFGKRGDALHVKIRRDGAEQDLTFARAAANSPHAPKGAGFPMTERPIINWRGQFAPCMGMQPSAELAFAYCDKHFASFGFILMKDFSSTGFQVDAAKRDPAVVTAVDAGSPAALAGLKVGDAIVALEGQPLTGSAGANARMLLFGKAGQEHKLIVKRGGTDIPVTINLGPKASGDAGSADKAS
jgi:S1-C subfamily serine protease